MGVPGFGGGSEGLVSGWLGLEGVVCLLPLVKVLYRVHNSAIPFQSGRPRVRIENR